MKKKVKKELIQWAAIAAVFIFLFATGLHTEVFGFLQRGVLATGLMKPDVEQTAETNDLAADLNMQLINSEGKQVNLKNFEGKVIFLNVWATWCPPCIAEMPGINKLYKDLKDENVEFVMLSVDEKFEKAIDFQKRKNYDFEIYQSVGRFPQMFNGQSLPTTYIIDTNGNLVLTHAGMADYHNDEFKEYLRELM
ncbi:MAG TPA: TlpA disulfide reductase family protein [Salinimicrobium sp.]|nr:TlpA disulfide reductase family protein [Salinimicrobium sp.]